MDSLWNEMKTINISEDCLYLNVYVPTTQEKNRKRAEHCGSKRELKTVMVYFHGGSFLYGANSFKFFDATNLAAFANIVVVVPNYRLGILGFLSSYPRINGNFGLYDQLEALKWVQKNIAAFGGDPGRVVLFGQNAGAISIGLHLISPLSKNLFRRAILESGNPLSWLTVFEQKNAKVFTIKVANISNCPLEIGMN
jgi:acetylcholinesterase/cholinesterase